MPYSPTMKTSGQLFVDFETRLPDNNGGLISAADIREPLLDTVYSIQNMVASGQTETDHPFKQNVTFKHTSEALADVVDSYGGTIFVESGIMFPNAGPGNNPTELQTEPFRGFDGLKHNELADLDVDDPHPQYYALDGARALTSSFKAGGSFWINASGDDDVGFRFDNRTPDGKMQDIRTSGSFIFDDNSQIANAKGTAKAWLFWDASGEIAPYINRAAINSYHNISGIERLNPGKFKITFTSGTFGDNNYVAIGTSNGRNAATDPTDFSINTVGLVKREGNDGTSLRSITYCIMNGLDNYVDAELNHFVAYGYAPTETSGTPPTSTISTSYTVP